MRKLLKYFAVGLSLLSTILLLFLTVSFENHRINLSKEESLFIPNGQLVEINDRKMHVYTEGTGAETLVFMSGGGTSSPVLDFKTLYSRLSDKYRIVVIEKVGYGFSDIADVERTIDDILNETRLVLDKAEIEEPYILVPHSMSGIEALYWAQEYPDEVTAIIGLDMASPAVYENYKINLPLIKLASFASNIGLTRWFPEVAESDAIKYGSLTKEEKETYRAVFYRRTLTEPMLSEIEVIKKNAKKVGVGGIPDVPMLLFSSNGEGTGWSKKEWSNHQQNYSEKVVDGELIQLDAAHYIHNIEYERIAEEIKEFMLSLN